VLDGLPREGESVLPTSLRLPLFLRTDREECAAPRTLKTATDLSMCTLLGASYFGAHQHRDAAIIAYGSRIFLREDFAEGFHTTHDSSFDSKLTWRGLPWFLCGMGHTDSTVAP
jgi:hypothetical protein